MSTWRKARLVPGSVVVMHTLPRVMRTYCATHPLWVRTPPDQNTFLANAYKTHLQFQDGGTVYLGTSLVELLEDTADEVIPVTVPSLWRVKAEEHHT